MTLKEAFAALKKAGTAQNRKVYGRHGVKGEMFGVSYAALGMLKKKIKLDHALAVQLWKTGNHDARVFATMVADPTAATGKEIDVWVKDLDNYVITDAFAALVSRSPFAQKKTEKWIDASGEWVGRAGWLVLARMARESAVPDSYFVPHLDTIEHKIHTRKNHVRDAMNSALIAIGLRNPRMRALALAVAARIGKVDVDHGETGCKTPDAASYIMKVATREGGIAPQTGS